MNYLPFHEALEDCSRLAGKVPQASCILEGDFPVIGQGKQEVEGFTNDPGLVFRGDLPVILFGDHTAAFKFINRPFARGADGTKLFRPRTEHLDAKFAWHFLRTIQLPQTGYDRKTKYLENVEIPLPPLEEQRRIAAILDKTNELNRLRECYQALCRDLELSIFYNEFGSPGANPFGWPTIPLAEMAEIFSDGPFGSNLKSSHYVESGIRVVRLQNIGIGAFLEDDQAFVDPSHYETIKKHSCLPGDVLIGTLGDPNLRACILPDGIPVAINKADCIQMRCDTSRSTAAYITHLLNLPEVNQMASSLILGQTRGRISMGRLKGFEVPMPPLEKQIQFARKIHALNSLRKIGASSASTIRDLIDSYSSWALAPSDCQ